MSFLLFLSFSFYQPGGKIMGESETHGRIRVKNIENLDEEGGDKRVKNIEVRLYLGEKISHDYL